METFDAVQVERKWKVEKTTPDARRSPPLRLALASDLSGNAVSTPPRKAMFPSKRDPFRPVVNTTLGRRQHANGRSRSNGLKVFEIQSVNHFRVRLDGRLEQERIVNRPPLDPGDHRLA